MDQRMYKIYNKEDFDRITKGIKVAQCMQSRSSSETDNVVTQLEELVVSDSLSCSFCNTVFEDKKHQRLHYKLDWHRYNLKQRLNGLKSISEDSFNLLADEGDVSSLSGSEVDSDNEDDTGTSETGGSSSVYTKNNESISKNENSSIVKSKKQEKKGKSAELVSDSSDTECNEEISREKKNQELLAIANRHSKVFFENDDGNIFNAYFITKRFVSYLFVYHTKNRFKLMHIILHVQMQKLYLNHLACLYLPDQERCTYVLGNS
ncbi:ankyrin repeat and zinc finger domain-containing protein 1-like isoform X1 [Vespula maculifrons]|uniref:Ankyrin repeat and zinc finger domain-containing protein 1-like isoform X1 n=1 Tax=Vespula maculifrons TaxID=7453 RepID=A0ABD2BCB1_VESMC